MSDNNYFSIHGDPDGTLWQTVGLGGNAVVTKLRDGLWPVYEIDDIIILGSDLILQGIDLNQISDIFKLSHVQNIHIKRLIVLCGGLQKENAADFNFECTNVTIDHMELEEGDQNAWTCKGGCSAIKIGALGIHASGRAHCNIELGNWSDQSKKKTHDIKITELVEVVGGGVVQIRVDYASRPQIQQGNIHWQIWQGLLIDLWVRIRLILP